MVWFGELFEIAGVRGDEDEDADVVGMVGSREFLDCSVDGLIGCFH